MRKIGQGHGDRDTYAAEVADVAAFLTPFGGCLAVDTAEAAEEVVNVRCWVLGLWARARTALVAVLERSMAVAGRRKRNEGFNKERTAGQN